jgi:hypothetical protein
VRVRRGRFAVPRATFWGIVALAAGLAAALLSFAFERRGIR